MFGGMGNMNMNGMMKKVQKMQKQMQEMQEQLKQQDAEIEANLVAARGYTNAQIAQNNEFLMEEISKGLIDLKVLNLFTGKYVTVQEMFDYLSAFHMTGAISVAQIGNAQRTVNTVVGYNATCTDIVINGYQIFYPG